MASLIGYLVVSDHLGRVHFALESVGEVIVWQLAWSECDFLTNARVAAGDAMLESPPDCDQDMPLLLKYKYFLDDDKTPWTVGTLEANAAKHS